MGATVRSFGSRIDRSRSLTGDALCMAVLDTAVALLAGLIIFPACFSLRRPPRTAAPDLLFVTLPNVFNANAAADGSGGRCSSCSWYSPPSPR